MTESAKPPEGSGWEAAAKRILKLALPTVLAGAGLGFTVPAGVSVRLLAIALIVLGLLWIARFETHLEMPYLRWKSRAQKWLAAMVVAEGPIGVGFLASGVMLMVRSNQSTHELSLTEAACAAGLLVAVAVHSFVLARLIEKLGLSSASKDIETKCKLVGVLADFGRRIGLTRFVDWSLTKAPDGEVSALVKFFLVALVCVILGNGRAIGSEIVEMWGNPPPSQNDTRKDEKKKDETKKERQGADAGGHGGDGSPAGPSSGGDATIPPAEPPPAKRDDCTSPQPGHEATEPQRTALYNQWFGPHEGLGTPFAGCPNKAHQVGGTDVWVVAGVCEGKLRSLAVADGDGIGAILLWGPARFALRHARDGSLRGATRRATRGSGDLYTVTTTAGTYVFARRELSDGSGGLDRPPEACSEVAEDSVPYVRVPPALTRLWQAEMASGSGWLWPIATGSGRFAFRGLDPADNRRITATCVSDVDCELWVDGRVSRDTGAGAIDPEQLLEHAPPAPRSP